MRSPVLRELEAEMAMTGIHTAGTDWTAAGTTVSHGRNRKSLELRLFSKSDCPMAYDRVT